MEISHWICYDFSRDLSAIQKQVCITRVYLCLNIKKNKLQEEHQEKMIILHFNGSKSVFEKLWYNWINYVCNEGKSVSLSRLNRIICVFLSQPFHLIFDVIAFFFLLLDLHSTGKWFPPHQMQLSMTLAQAISFCELTEFHLLCVHVS